MPETTAADYKNPALPAEQRAEDLLGQLTLDEKCSLCAGRGFWKTKGVPRLGLKPFMLTDGPRGVGFHSSNKRCTAFPSGIAQAATWDVELLARFGAALGQECRAAGGGTILGPAINICRTPLNGRTFEYFSEDPYLNSQLVVPIVRGVQAQGIAACVKHFAANNQETDRVRISSEVSERALQEIYLPAFRAAVEEGDAWAVMSAYNKVNGVPASANADLLKRRLRDEWGFRGFVVSDWFAPRFAGTTASCVKGGLSLEMPGKGSPYKKAKVSEAYHNGLITERDIDDNLRGLLTAMALTGHLDPERRRAVRNTPEHQSLAREIAETGMTLVKNEERTLPLRQGEVRKVALLGPSLKKRFCLPLYGGSAGVWSPYEVTAYKGLLNENRGRFEFVKNPQEADVVLFFAGLSHRPGQDSEVRDRVSLSLPGGQDEMIARIAAQNPNTVVVLYGGSPVTMPWLDDVRAVLLCWYPGMEGGAAIARTLFGDSNPSGKLPVTFPRSLADSPAHTSARTYPGDKRTVHYDEELFVGYRHFDRRGIEPLFPFGHGLSYTHFEYGDITLAQDTLERNDSLTVSMTLANGGDCCGTEVVQAYIADLDAPDDRPLQALKGFARHTLEVGERRTVAFDIPATALQVFCPKTERWVLRSGRYEVRIGSSSRDIRLSALFQVRVGSHDKKTTTMEAP